MLEPKDLEMIAEIMAKAIQPLKDDIAELKTDVAELKKDVAELKTEVAQLKKDVAELKTEVAQLKKDVAELRSDVEMLKSSVKNLEDRAAKTESRMTSIELTLENETNKGINIIAEGHQDLDRKLNRALKIEEEKEILMLRVNYLESELCKVKSKLNEIVA